MHVLLTNDDGVKAPGLRALIDALRDRARLTVVAPDRQRSASGLAITLHRSVTVDEVAAEDGLRIYECSGTPTDCVAVALYALCGGEPDLVISGINDGANLGEDIHYSGTFGAALEARLLGVPAAAVSAIRPADDTPMDFGCSAEVAVRLVDWLAAAPRLPDDVVLNVNVPPLAFEALAGSRVTRSGSRGYAADVRIEQDSAGRNHYWVYGGPQDPSPGPDTDIAAIRDGCVSITPITYRTTAIACMEALADTGLTELLG